MLLVQENSGMDSTGNLRNTEGELLRGRVFLHMMAHSLIFTSTMNLSSNRLRRSGLANTAFAIVEKWPPASALPILPS